MLQCTKRLPRGHNRRTDRLSRQFSENKELLRRHIFATGDIERMQIRRV
jgi:hypothetical protein